MNSRFSLLLTLLPLCILTSVAEARPCNSAEHDIAAFHARAQASRLVDADDGGTNIRETIRDCRVIALDNWMDVTIDLHWNGSVRASRSYAKSGRLGFRYSLTAPRSATNITWTETWASESLRDYRSGRAWFGGLVLLTAGVACLSSDGCRDAVTGD